jgi:hypothetical protein
MCFRCLTEARDHAVAIWPRVYSLDVLYHDVKPAPAPPAEDWKVKVADELHRTARELDGPFRESIEDAVIEIYAANRRQLKDIKLSMRHVALQLLGELTVGRLLTWHFISAWGNDWLPFFKSGAFVPDYGLREPDLQQHMKEVADCVREALEKPQTITVFIPVVSEKKAASPVRPVQ